MLAFLENVPTIHLLWISHVTRRDHIVRATRAVVVALLTMGLVGWITSISVEAHAALEESSPPPNAIVATAPPNVTMRFTEPLERSYSKAELYDQDGNLVPDATVGEGGDDYTMVLDLPPDLARGTYTVLWRSLSTADGHTAQNYLAFTVGTAADVDTNATTAETTSSGPPLWLTTLARWTALVGLASALAVWPIWIFVLRPAISAAWRIGPQLTRSMRGFAVSAVIVAFLGNLFAMLVQASSLTDGSYLDALRETLGDTRYGRIWLIRIALLFLYGLALQWTAWWRPQRTPAMSALALASAIALPVPFSLIAHASAQTTGRSSAIFNDFIHLLAASIWIGGLIALVVVLLPTLRGLDPGLRRQVLARALPRFSTVALTAWVSLALTGFYSAWLHVGNVDALLHTDYGKTLIIKLIILVPILFLAAFNLFFVTRHLDRASGISGDSRPWVRRLSFSVGAEAALAIAVLVVVGSLTSQAPAREAMASEPQQVAITFDGDDRQATLTLTPGVAGPNRYTLNIGGDTIPSDAAVLLRVELPAQDTGENEFELSRTESNEYVYQGSELSIGGEWNFTLLVRPPGEAEWRSSVSHEIGSARTDSHGPGPAWHFGTVSGIVGMVSILSGVAAIFAIRTSPAASRRRAIWRTGLVVIALGAVILYTGRVEPDSIEKGETRAVPQSTMAAPTWAIQETTNGEGWR